MNKINIIFWFIYIFIIVIFINFGLPAFQKLNINQITLFIASLAALLTFFHYETGIYLLIISMLFSPEIVLGHVRGRDVVLRVDDILILVIFFTWFAKVSITKKLRYFRFTPIHKPFLLFLSLCIFSTALGALFGYVRSPMKGLLYVVKFSEFFLVYFLTVNIITDQTKINKLLFFYFATLAAILIYVFISQPYYFSNYRITAPFEGRSGEPNTLGGYLTFSTVILLGISLKIKNNLLRTLLFGFIVFSVFLFLNTLSRSSYIAMIISLIVIFILTNRKILFLLLIIVLSVIFIKNSYLTKKVINRVERTFASSRQNTNETLFDDSTMARIYTYEKGVEIWKKNPFLGRGLTGGLFVDAYFLKILLEVGLLGLIFVFWLLYTVFKMSSGILRTKEISDINRGIVEGFIAGLFGLLGHSAGANTFMIVRIAGPFWIMAGIIGSIYFSIYIDKKQEGENKLWKLNETDYPL